MLPHGVIEDTKGEDNVSDDAGNIKRRNSKISKKDVPDNDYDIDKNSYFRDSFDEGRATEKDMFNSSLGGWDVNDEETRRKKRNVPKKILSSRTNSMPPSY